MASPYDKLLDMISCLDLQDDGIRMNHKIKSIEQDFCNIIKDEQMLSESMDYMNNKVLDDNEESLKFALLFSSRNFDSLAMNDVKVRCKMLNILQTNYSNAEKYRKDDKNRLYNSITLLGEYYHRVRLADGSPIAILGESLLGLLTQEIITKDLDETNTNIVVDLKLAKLILSQVTLNGDKLRETHKNELNNLLYHIRKILIEQNLLKASAKALLLMTLDLYYSNFTSLSPPLEEMYTKYLVEEDEINRGGNKEDKQENLDDIKNQETVQNENDSFNLENGNDCGFNMLPVSNKKWSEQVCEDSMYEEELLANNYCDNIDENTYQSLPPQPSASMLATKDVNKQKSSTKSPDVNNKNLKSPQLNINQPNNQQRSNHISNHYSTHNQQQQPKQNWGQPQQNSNRFNNRQNTNFEDDQNSVRSEGGSIKIYTVGDRLRHTQAPVSQKNNYSRNSQGRDNWDRGNGYHTYDGRRRSNSRNSNFENGSVNNVSGSYKNNNQQQNNRNNYDRPPRFRNADSSWRNNFNPNHNEQGNRPSLRGPDSRSSSINRNIHGPNRHSGNFENYNSVPPQSVSPEGCKRIVNDNFVHKEGNYHNRNGVGAGRHFTNQNNRSNQHHHQQQQHKQTRNFGRSNNHNYTNNRYGSNSSLTSDSGTWERRGRQISARRNLRGKSQDWEDTHSVHGQPDDNWKEIQTITGNNETDLTLRPCNNDEIVKNARNTTEYMQYLSQK